MPDFIRSATDVPMPTFGAKSLHPVHFARYWRDADSHRLDRVCSLFRAVTMGVVQVRGT